METSLPLQWAVFQSIETHWRAAKSYFASQNGAIRHFALETKTKVIMNWGRLATRLRERLNNRPEGFKQKNARLTEFENGYEDLIDLLCLTAHEGVRKESTSKYARMRNWMKKRYPKVQKALAPFWRETGTEREDPFTSLFAPVDIEEVINCNACIENITRSRCAMEECKKSLSLAV